MKGWHLQLIRIIFAFALVTFAACGSNLEKSSSEKSSQSPEMGIHAAALMGNLDAINAHIKEGTNLNEKDDYGSTPLNIAVTFNKKEAALALINDGVDLGITNNDGATALHTAAFFCRTEIVEALVNNGADKSIKNNFGSTALESGSGPFEGVKPIYDEFSKALGPLESLWVPMSIVNVWRIPLLFFVSGMGVCFALRKRNWKQLILERSRRILLPFLFGFF